jgi:hypothetical protein
LWRQPVLYSWNLATPSWKVMFSFCPAYFWEMATGDSMHCLDSAGLNSFAKLKWRDQWLSLGAEYRVL